MQEEKHVLDAVVYRVLGAVVYKRRPRRPTVVYVPRKDPLSFMEKRK